MEVRRFDSLTRAVAGRLTRRAALCQGTFGLAAVLGAGAVASTAAQGEPAAATPAVPPATPEAGGTTPLLFVQAYGNGSLAPKPGAAGVYALTLRDGLGPTIALSDRPARLTEELPTERLPDLLDFRPDDPPNAAVVTRIDLDEEAVLLVEVFAPRYDSATRTATYDVKLLADYGRFGAALAARARPPEHMPAAFGLTSLFIDSGGCIGLGDACNPNGGPPCCNVGHQPKCVAVTCTPNQPTQITGFTSNACPY